MNSDDLRAALQTEAQQQPALSPDFRSGIDRRVRGQRMRAVMLATPAIALIVLAAVVLMPRAGDEATVSTADGATAGTGVTTTSAAGTDPSVTTTGPATTGSTSCGTVNVSLPASVDVDTAAFTCFIDRFNADAAADLTIVMTSATGGSITQRVSTEPGHLLTVEANGSISTKLPAFSLGGGKDDAFPGATTDGEGDCGTFTIMVPDLETPSDTTATTSVPGAAEADAMECLLVAFTNGTVARLTLAMGSVDNATMTVSLTISDDHVLTLELDGTMRMHLPNDLAVPQDLLNAIPPATVDAWQVLPGIGGRFTEK